MPVTIASESGHPAIEHAVTCLVDAIGTTGAGVRRVPQTMAADICITTEKSPRAPSMGGFSIVRGPDGINVIAADARGAMYGTFEVISQLQLHGALADISDTTIEPAVAFRAVKFNLPWDPYRSGTQTEVHYETCRDLTFWRRFLDMMARNRFNALTLWNLHPFPYLIRPASFPEACPFDAAELAEWERFWRGLFRLADDRGIETYLLNWNIVVSPAFASAYEVDRFNDQSDIVVEYTRECIIQMLETYPGLDGLGVSLCDWMEGMDPTEKQAWFEETFLNGIAACDRPVKLLDRSVLTESIDAMRATIERAAAIENITDIRVPTKFNWSHGHSTTSLELTHDYGSGVVDDALWDPEPDAYRLAWTVRNEDCFVLRWADPDFIRAHLAENHTPHSFVDGYIIGSEGTIPAVDLAHAEPTHLAGHYAFERQWLFWTVWGRLLFDPTTPDEAFEAMIEHRFCPRIGEQLLEAIRLGSTVLEEIASLFSGTWDYTLYAEGMLAPAPSRGPHDDSSPFISVDELIHHEPLDPSYISIADYVAGSRNGLTPPSFADRVDRRANRTLSIVDELRATVKPGDGELACTIDDAEAWGHLGRYVAEKVRGGIALETFRCDGNEADQAAAVSHLRRARDQWDGLSAVTSSHYRPVPYAQDLLPGFEFAWAAFRDQVERDITLACTEVNGGS